MRHRVAGRILNRKPAHRKALFRNMMCRLVLHERIITTLAKAKELRPHIEKLITRAKKAQAAATAAGEAGSKPILHAARMRVAAELGNRQVLPTGKDDDDKKPIHIDIVEKIVNDLGKRYANRPGGYTRVLKRAVRRVGDAAPTAIIELLGADEPARPKQRRDDRPAKK